MKLVPIIMGYSLFQFDALKFFVGVHLHAEGPYQTLIFFSVNPQIFQRNRKFHQSNCLETNFHNISSISSKVIKRRNYT